jgi:cobalt-zinc-cadmium efflux system membrane fusion protein
MKQRVYWFRAFCPRDASCVALSGAGDGPHRPATAFFRRAMCFALFASLFFGTACSEGAKPAQETAEVTLETGVYQLDHPELFHFATVATRQLPAVVNANGGVFPDVNRTIHVTSLGSGRVVDLKVRLGDFVRKGETLLTISSSDLGGATSDYQKAVADEVLSRKALDRAQQLYSHGALAEKDLETAQDAEDKAGVDLHTTEQQVRRLGGDPAHPGALIELRAPVSGTIVEQNVAGSEGVKSLDNTPNLFTIADLSQVWVLCDVYENELEEVHLGDSAEIRVNAFSGKVYRGSVSDISRVLDPSTRSAKVRIVLANPNSELLPGMYAVATFHSRDLHRHLVAPAAAVMRLHDKDWVFHKESSGRVRQTEVHVVGVTEDGFQELQDGEAVKAGDEIVENALQFSTAMAEKKE